jgi:hypothetical protein
MNTSVDTQANSKAPLVERKDEARSKETLKKETEEVKVEKGRQNTPQDKPADEDIKG